MATKTKIRYTWGENTKTGTHSFYARPVFNGTLSMEQLLDEALDGKSIEPSVARAAITEFMKAVQRNVLKGFRCQLGENFLTVYPNLTLSVKDYTDKKTGQLVVATPDMLNAANASSRLGCTVHKEFSAEFARSVSWQKTDKTGAAVEEEDITEGNQNVDGSGDNTQTETPETPANNEGGSAGSDSGTGDE